MRRYYRGGGPRNNLLLNEARKYEGITNPNIVLPVDYESYDGPFYLQGLRIYAAEISTLLQKIPPQKITLTKLLTNFLKQIQDQIRTQEISSMTFGEKHRHERNRTMSDNLTGEQEEYLRANIDYH